MDDVLDYKLKVDLKQDLAMEYHNDGTVKELVISEHVIVTEIPDSTTRIIDEAPLDYALLTEAATDYIDNEPWITALGNQILLGTSVYDGYEVMGSRTYTSPSEVGYLQRKNSGYVIFDSNKFTITAGTLVGTAIGMIAAITQGPLAIIEVLLCGMLGATVDGVIDYLVEGTYQCREYRWDYRVRRNSNTGSTLLSEYKLRYWWEMYDNSGHRRLEPRTEISDGWLLSNSDMIAYALGRM